MIKGDSSNANNPNSPYAYLLELQSKYEPLALPPPHWVPHHHGSICDSSGKVRATTRSQSVERAASVPADPLLGELMTGIGTLRVPQLRELFCFKAQECAGRGDWSSSSSNDSLASAVARHYRTACRRTPKCPSRDRGAKRLFRWPLRRNNRTTKPLEKRERERTLARPRPFGRHD